MTYAARTQVPVDRSRAEIEKSIQRYGADEFHSGWGAATAYIEFKIKGVLVRLTVPLPKQDARNRDQLLRQRWRAMVLIVKAKLEAVQAGISTIEAEFLAGVVLPSGDTVGEQLVPRIKQLDEKGIQFALAEKGTA